MKTSVPTARVGFYRVAPKACTPKRALAAIVACSREQQTSGLGLAINIEYERQCVGHLWAPEWCGECRTEERVKTDRVCLSTATAKLYGLSLWTASRFGSHSAKIHICRAVPTKADLRRARRARSYAARRLRALGYQVEFVDDDGGVRLQRPTRRFVKERDGGLVSRRIRI